MVITLSSLRDMVDYFGGVEVRLDREIVCKPDQVLPEGLQLLNGERAEWLLRHRSSYQNADLGRINAQQIFLQAAFSTAKKAGKIKCLQAAVKYHGRLKTDLPLAKTMALAEAALNLGADDIQTFTVPVRGASYGTYSVVEVSRYSFAKLLSEHFSAGQTVTAEMLDTRYVPYVPPASSDAAQDDFQDPGEEPDDGWGDYAQLSPDEEESEGLIIHQP
jgi:anionic cell wall polymer biosynthesis LytR-Cps2A-Psr (LCP) family protein